MIGRNGLKRWLLCMNLLGRKLVFVKQSSIPRMKSEETMIWFLALQRNGVQRQKVSFFSWGEATITLEDMMISGCSVLGSPVFSPLVADEMKAVEEELNQVRMELQNSASQKARHSIWLKRFMDRGSEIEHEAFLALWLSRFVFPFSFRTVSKSVFPIALHLARGTRIVLAPAVLASIYRGLS